MTERIALKVNIVFIYIDNLVNATECKQNRRSLYVSQLSSSNLYVYVSLLYTGLILQWECLGNTQADHH